MDNPSTVLDMNDIQISDIQLPDTSPKTKRNAAIKYIPITSAQKRQQTTMVIKKIPLRHNSNRSDTTSIGSASSNRSNQSLTQSDNYSDIMLEESPVPSVSTANTTIASSRMSTNKSKQPQSKTLGAITDNDTLDGDSSESQNVFSLSKTQTSYSQPPNQDDDIISLYSLTIDEEEDNISNHQYNISNHQSTRIPDSYSESENKSIKQTPKPNNSTPTLEKSLSFNQIQSTIAGLKAFQQKISESEFYDEEDVQVVESYCQTFQDEQQRRIASEKEIQNMKRILDGRLTVLNESMSFVDFEGHQALTDHFARKQKKLEELYCIKKKQQRQ